MVRAVFQRDITSRRPAGGIHACDELIRATEGAHNALLDLEDIDEKQMDMIRKRYADLAEQARQGRQRGRPDTDRPRVDT